MAGLHDLSHGARGGDCAKELDEEGVAQALAMNRTRAGREQLEVGAPRFVEWSERRRQRAGRARTLLEQSLLVRAMLDVFADTPRPAMLRDLLCIEEDGNEIVVRAHDDLLRREPPRYGIA